MLFCNRRLTRVIACYLLLQTVSNLVFSTVSLALTGPGQPEFSNSESGSTEVVDLLTGDFNYSLPILDVPGPERSFSLPLTYKSGIQLDQDASWVGLGWSLSAGAITRTVNGYPDDANNEPVITTFYKKIDQGWTGGFGNLINFGWSRTNGRSGGINILDLAHLSWDKNGISNAGLLDVVNSKDPARITAAYMNLVSLGSSIVKAHNNVPNGLGDLALNQAYFGTIGGIAGFGRTSGVPGYNNNPVTEIGSELFYDNFWTYYNDKTTENTFGSLYFGKMSRQTQNTSQLTANQYTNALDNYDSPPPIRYDGAQSAIASSAKLFKFSREITNTGNTYVETAADIYQDGTPGDDVEKPDLYSTRELVNDLNELDALTNKETSRRPISTAHDYFNVMGGAAAGTIRPYRLDVGSVAYPKLEANVRGVQPGLGTVPHYKHMAVSFLDRKVGFRYENNLSNGYNYHQFPATSGVNASGFSVDADGRTLAVADPRLLTGSRTAPARKGLYDESSSVPRLVQGKEVVWYNNLDIRNMYGQSSDGIGNGFLEFEHPNGNNIFRRYAPPSGIGAFAITVEDGTTYHYSLPVYQYGTYMEANEVTTQIGGLGKMTRRTGVGAGYDPVYNPATNPVGPHATAWLLTAITSADYVDRNGSGTVDESDTGGWVKFSYGRFSSQYKWRQPYIGTSYTDEQPAISSRSFTEGYKETYYLNSISTRTHTALFVKSVRQDGRGHFQLGGSSNLGIDNRLPASSLRLDEIILLDNATLKRVQTPDGIRDDSDPTAVPALTNATGSNLGTYPDDPMRGAGDDMGTVLDIHDLDGDTRIQKFVYAKALRRIRFNYDYDLCRGTPNSFTCRSGQPNSLPDMTENGMYTNRGGKLTLKSISFFGPSSNNKPTKTTPDFVFSYEATGVSASDTNPGYGKEQWDAFGMYLPGGTSSVNGHRPSQTPWAAPWTLTKITTPLGGVTEISYERDQYSHVSEYGTRKIHLTNSDCSSTFNITQPFGGVAPPTTLLSVGQTVYLTGKARYNNCLIRRPSINSSNSEPVSRSGTRAYSHQPFRIEALTDNQITISPALTPNSPCGAATPAQGAELDLVVPNNVIGGDVRVAAITTREGSGKYEVRYKYTMPGQASGNAQLYNSSGVIAREPDFLDRFKHPFENWFDYPTTPVFYQRVTVLQGLFRNGDDNDYQTREVYSFHPPTSQMISEVVPAWQNLIQGPSSFMQYIRGNGYLLDNKHNRNGAVVSCPTTTVNVGLIGQPQKVEKYNRRGELELSTEFIYGNEVQNADAIAGQGHYTEGLFNTERVRGVYRINRSTKTYVPTVLLGTRSRQNNLTTNSRNVLFDFYTGQLLETAATNSLNQVVHSRTVPAYALPGNEEMKPKGDNPANQHMLAQPGAAYTFMEVPGGPAYNPLNPLNPATSHVLSASVQTWQSNWPNYREADASGAYQDVAGQRPVWRQAATYTWQSPVLESDGSFKNFTPFNWTGTSDQRWLKAGETVRYDHYSHAVEARDLNGQYATQKTGYNQTQLIASASNARYTEVAYSGAEDQFLAGGITQFGGEVVAGGLPVLATPAQPAHTGFYSLQLKNGEKGFLYRAQVGRDIDADKVYRLSVWASATATDGKLYVARNGSRLAASTLTAATTKKAGNWYLLTLLYKVPASANGQTLEFGCANDGTTAAYFDDFRLAPLTATVTSKVYDPRTNNLLYSLDNDNLFTHYEYTPTGRLKRVYQETLDGTGSSATAEKLVKEYDYNYSRLFFPTWVTTAYRCATDNDGNYTGSEERQLTDVNPLNQPPTPMKWEANGTCSTCLPPPVPFEFTVNRIPYRLRNNKWEQPSPYGSPTRQTCPQGHRWVFSWIYANGDRPADTFGDCMYGAN